VDNPTVCTWHISAVQSNSPPNSCVFNDGVDYDTGAQEYGSLYSPWVDLPAGCSFAEFSFWEWRAVENFPPYDVSQVYISNDGVSWSMLYEDHMSVGSWTQRTFDISGWIGTPVKFQFFFDTLDAFVNAFEGWYIDDVQVLCPEYGAQWIPAGQSAFGSQGQVMTYTMDLQNIGRFLDDFTFTTASALGWPVTVLDAMWNPVATSGRSPLALWPRSTLMSPYH
jgi:hypothetical protein